MNGRFSMHRPFQALYPYLHSNHALCNCDTSHPEFVVPQELRNPELIIVALSQMSAKRCGTGVIRTYEKLRRYRDNIPHDEASELRKRCGTTVVSDATSGLTPLLHQFTLNSTWLLRSAPSKTGCFL